MIFLVLLLDRTRAVQNPAPTLIELVLRNDTQMAAQPELRHDRDPLLSSKKIKEERRATLGVRRAR